MNKTRLIKTTRKKELFIYLIFIVISCWYACTLAYSGKLIAQNDAFFHLQRLQQIYLNLKHGVFFTFIATDTFRHIGVGSFLFYPTAFYYPIAILEFVFKPITVIYIYLGLAMFLTFCCAYVSMKTFSKSIQRAFIFSMVYTLCAKYIIEFTRFQFGEFFAYSFIPIVFLGFYQVVYSTNKKTLFNTIPISSLNLGIGLALIVTCHLLSAFLCILLMLILLIIQILRRKINKYVLFSLIENVIVFFLLAGWVIFPLFMDYFGNNISSAKPGFNAPTSFEGLWFSSFQNQIFSNYSDVCIGIVLILTFCIGWLFIRNNYLELSIYSIGFFLVIISTSLFPWASLQRLPFLAFLSVLQYSFRFLILAVFFLSVSSSYIICYLINACSNKNFSYLLVFVFVILLILSSYQILESIKLYQNNNFTYLKKNYKDKNILPPNPVILNNHNFNYVVNYRPPIGDLDYVNNNSFGNSNGISMENNEVIVNNKKRILSPYLSPNIIEYKIKVNDDSVIDLPIVPYKHSIVTVNGKETNWDVSKRGSICLRVSKGTKSICVTYKPYSLFYVLFIISLMSYISILYLLPKSKRLIQIRLISNSH